MANRRSKCYCCRFCSEFLIHGDNEGAGRFSPIKPYKCPHCFSRYSRPPEILGRIPVVLRLFNRKGVQVDDGRREGFELAENQKLPFTPLGMIAKVARFTAAVEKHIWNVFVWLLRALFTRETKSSSSSGRPHRRRTADHRG